MKKVVCVMVVAVLSLTLAGCGGPKADQASVEQAATSLSVEDKAAASAAPADGPADTAAAPESAATVASSSSASQSSNSSSSQSSDSSASQPQASEPRWNLPEGSWSGRDRFSGESPSGLGLTIREATADKIVFNYSSPSGDSYSGLTAYPDSSGKASVDAGGGVSLEITFSDNYIMLDEIEAMGAMAYEFSA